MGGQISGANIQLATGHFDNTGGQVLATGKLTARTLSLNNTAGVLLSTPSTGFVPAALVFQLRMSNTAPLHKCVRYRTSAGGAWDLAATLPATCSEW